ncbi:MAG TPA: flagellar hook-associated protein FlgK [bacterium]
MGISGILDMGRRALEMAQMRVQTTAHNISNAATDSYSRQIVLSQTTRPQLVQGGLLGTGVQPDTVERITSRFLENQLLAERQVKGQLDLLATAFSHVEEVFSESQVGGLSEAMSAFFASWQDLATNPEGVAERQVLVSQAGALTRQFSLYAQGLARVSTDMLADLKSSVATVNEITLRITETNKAIVSAEAGGQPANDLRDSRDRLLNELANLTEFSVIDNGEVNDFTVQVRGQTLVQGVRRQSITVVDDGSGSPSLAVEQGAGWRTFFALPELGRIGGALSVLRESLPAAEEGLNEVAVFLAANVNAYHRQGYAIDGTTGLNFFLSPMQGAPNPANTGGAMITSTPVVDGTQFTAHRYEISFVAADSYQVTDVDTGAVVVPAAPANYVSGNPILFDGVSATITNGGGPPAAGDLFVVDINPSYFSSIAVDSAIETNPQRVAAALSLTGLPADNENALRIASLDSQAIMSGGTGTLIDSLSSLVSQAGIDSSRATVGLERQSLVVDQVLAQREAVSGVSIDEEAANLVEFQRSYQAAARVITTVDRMLETLLNT